MGQNSVRSRLNCFDSKLIGKKNCWAAVFKKSYKITGTSCEVEPYMLRKLLKHTTFYVWTCLLNSDVKWVKTVSEVG
ncbi:hypothetical protein HanIR_Chr11g0518251 [Helianthus annuus]|nr:hypothetical protein HanIR_Chr11g0518251 [Helianthus annuus]